MSSPKALPNRAKSLRMALGKKRGKVAEDLGVDQTTLWRWEERRSAIPDDKKVALATYYGTSVDWLMGWSEEDAA